MTHELLDSVAATTAHRDRDDLDRSVALLLLRFLETQSVTVYRLMEDGRGKRLARRVSVDQVSGMTDPQSVDTVSDLPLLSDHPDWQEAASSNQVVRCDGVHSRKASIFPIHGGSSEVVGLLVIETPIQLTSREIDLVQGILAVLKNHLALLDYGERDTLTGLLNRKTFEAHFQKLCERLGELQNARDGRLSAERRSTATREPGWLALIDVDRFKSINDGYGHLFGDEVLLLISRIMRRSLRGADHLFRFGGEEFVVVLDHASEAGVHIAFERLREAIEENVFPQVGRVTVSIGYTRINPGDVSTLCVERADAALYHAKSHGRNSVRSWEALMAAGELNKRIGMGEVELF
jgi:diguanylate cyclase (GGDEF)-like protein